MKVLGIDIGGTKSIVGIGDGEGGIITHKRVATPGSQGADATLAAIKELAHELIEESGTDIDCVGVACGGPLDIESGTVVTIPNQPGWDNMPVARIFEEEFGARIYVDNDAVAAAYGELMCGAGRDVQDFVYLTVSTGIGGAIVVRGEIYRGHGGNSAEIGHIKIQADGPKCTCGDRGCLESLASGTSIARMARQAMADRPDSLLWKNVHSPNEIDAETVVKAAKHGDSLALNVWEQAMNNLGLGIASVVNVLNPGMVIIGGGLSKAGDMLLDPVRKIVSERAMKALTEDVEIVPAANPDLAVLLGISGLAARHYTRQRCKCV